MFTIEQPKTDREVKSYIFKLFEILNYIKLFQTILSLSLVNDFSIWFGALAVPKGILHEVHRATHPALYMFMQEPRRWTPAVLRDRSTVTVHGGSWGFHEWVIPNGLMLHFMEHPIYKWMIWGEKSPK